MKTLSKDFTKRAFRYKQVERIGDLAIYHQTEECFHRSYEVIKVRKLPPRVFKGRQFEATEAYPSSGHWGVLGWTCPTLERARAKLYELSRK